MWIEHTHAADPDSRVGTAAIRHEELTNGEFVEFTDSGTAHVTRDIGESLVGAIDAIEPVTDDSDSDTSD